MSRLRTEGQNESFIMIQPLRWRLTRILRFLGMIKSNAGFDLYGLLFLEKIPVEPVHTVILKYFNVKE